MIINHSHAFVFVHVPKAAGTSLSRALKGFATYKDQEIGGTPFGELIQPYMKRTFRLAKHSAATEVRNAMGQYDFHGYYSFAFVRNPYTRAYSIFNYLKRQHATKKDSFYKYIAKFDTFEAFVASHYFTTDGVDRIFRPQTFWTDLPDGRSLSFIGSVENINEDMEAVIRQIRLNTPPSQIKDGEQDDALTVREENRSTTGTDQLWEILRTDPATEEKLFKRYQSDFKAYGYQRFDPDQPQYDEQRKLPAA